MLKLFSFLTLLMKRKTNYEESAFLKAQSVLSLFVAVNFISLTFLIFGRNKSMIACAFVLWVCFYIGLHYFFPNKKVFAYAMTNDIYSKIKKEAQLLMLLTIILFVISIVITS